MALYKEIELGSGIVITYHRVLHYIVSVNDHIWVEVKSYISKEKRDEEVAINESENEELWWDGYVVANCFSMPYKENPTVQDMYDFLKTTPTFEGATDI